MQIACCFFLLQINIYRWYQRIFLLESFPHCYLFIVINMLQNKQIFCKQKYLRHWKKWELSSIEKILTLNWAFNYAKKWRTLRWKRKKNGTINPENKYRSLLSSLSIKKEIYKFGQYQLLLGMRYFFHSLSHNIDE